MALRIKPGRNPLDLTVNGSGLIFSQPKHRHMKYFLFLLLSFSASVNAQHTKEEVIEIIGVFHLTDFINDEGQIYLISEVEKKTEFPMHTIVPTLGRLERNTTGGFYSAQVLAMLENVYTYETIYRSGSFIWISMIQKAGIKDTRNLSESRRKRIKASWRQQMMSHPGYLTELALGENILDTIHMNTKQPLNISYAGLHIDWNNYPNLVPSITSIYEKTTPRLLELLLNLKLIKEDIYQTWKADMDAHGYYAPAYVLGELAKEMGELETKRSRINKHIKLLDTLVSTGLMTMKNSQKIKLTDSLVASSETGAFLPYLDNTQCINFPAEGTIEEGYSMLLSALTEIDPTLANISFSLKQIKRPEGRDTTGEYFEIELSQTKNTATTIIHASEESGDKPGEPPRMLFIPAYLKVADQLLTQAGSSKRLYTASMWRQLDESKILPIYISLIDSAHSRLIRKGYLELGLSGNR